MFRGRRTGPVLLPIIFRPRELFHFAPLWALTLGLLFATSCTRTATPPRERALTIPSTNGVALSATAFLPSTTRPPGIVLLHSLGTDRAEWSAFARRAQEEGYLSLAIDLGGHGESQIVNGEQRPFRSFTADEWPRLADDVNAAHGELVRLGADPGRIAIMGADIGANLAALHAASNPIVRATVLISPGRDYRGIVVGPELMRSDKRPMLLLVSEGDTYSASICSALHKAAPGYSELRSYAGTAHGADLLDAHPDAVEQILAWLDTIIGDGPLG